MNTMKIRDYISNIIAEEFQFLNQKNEEYDVLSNNKFQKQFILDSIYHKNIKRIDFDFHMDDYGLDAETNNISLESNIQLKYKNVMFEISFHGDEIPCRIYSKYDAGDYYNEPQGEQYFTYIDWNSINVEIFLDGDSVKFVEFDKASTKIKELFIKSYLKDMIENQSIDIKD